MDRRKRLTLLCLVAGAVFWLAGCGLRSADAPPSTATVPPRVTLLEGPEQICRVANQIRLAIQTEGIVPGEPPGAWALQSGAGTSLQAGDWTLRDGALLIPFPDGEALPPAAYTVVLSWGDQELGRHTFAVTDTVPALSNLGVSLVPGGEAASRFAPGMRILYAAFDFQGGCPGAPYWVTVRDAAGAALCSQSGVLAAMAGTESVPCYRKDGQPFAEDDYQVEVTLMGEVTDTEAFAIETARPTPTAAPTSTAAPPVLACDPLFSAAGITPGGEPFLPLTLFDWYTEAVYVGSRCVNLGPSTSWQSAWYREGLLVRQESGIWTGAEEGIVWDSLTGKPGNPFLAPGAYTVTLEIGATAPLTTAFSVYAYQPQTPQEPAPQQAP